MQNRRSGDNIKGWTRLAAGLGALLSQPRVRAQITDLFKDRMSSAADTVSNKYDDAVHRVGAAKDALQGRNRLSRWPARAAGFAVGLGVGAGIGLLLAPKSGGETRGAIRGQAVHFKNTVLDSANSVIGRASKSVA